MLQVTRYPTATEYLSQCEALFARDEIANNLILGIPGRLRDHPEDDKPENLYLLARDEDKIVGAVAMTPPYNLIVHVEPDAPDAHAVLAALLDTVLALQGNVPGMVGRVPWVGMAATLWNERTDRRMVLDVSERVFELRTVIPPRPAPGKLRRATLDDLPLTVEWRRAFEMEALREDGKFEYTEHVHKAIAQERYYLWVVPDGEDSRPVSLVAIGRLLPHGRSIGPVYTPPAERGKGYAGNATAAISQLVLDQGYDYATLFTDLANPTANKIYQAIGYTPVCDYDMWKVE